MSEEKKFKKVNKHTVQYWHKKLRLFVILHGGKEWWLNPDIRPCVVYCRYGTNGGCAAKVGTQLLRASYDLSSMYLRPYGKGAQKPAGTWCANWIKYV